MFFFEKKNQKTFRLWRTRPGERTRQRTKVFCFFASEKKTFLPLLAIPLCAAEPNRNQTLVDGTSPPATAAFILPASPVTPFYQWENNNGYCGEVSLLQAGLAHGQWLDQLNTRLVCGTGLSQSGPSGACAAHDHIANYNAQLLIETPGTGVSGSHIYADAPQCMANARLNGVTFPYETQATGLAGYQQYMSWVKAQVIAGNQVTLAVLLNGGSDPQYDHEVAVLKIGTNHAVTDPSYYPDDVVYFDDHGAYTLEGHHFTDSPAIPPGAGRDSTGCTPYSFGYSFASLANTRAGANRRDAQGYSIIIPEAGIIHTGTGGTGYNTVPILGPHNYAFAVSGPIDESGETVPVSLAITGPTRDDGKANPADPIAGYNYENPMIGVSVHGNGCTDKQPAPMTHVTLNATVTGLHPGAAYNLYEYDIATVQGTGNAAALPVPVADFNANAAMATHVTHFVASGPSYAQSVTAPSQRSVVFRCVPADAP
jgi:hypothetical protein